MSAEHVRGTRERGGVRPGASEGGLPVRPSTGSGPGAGRRGVIDGCGDVHPVRGGPSARTTTLTKENLMPLTRRQVVRDSSVAALGAVAFGASATGATRADAAATTPPTPARGPGGRDGYTFELDESVTRSRVRFRNRYGIEVAGDLYVPRGARRRGRRWRSAGRSAPSRSSRRACTRTSSRVGGSSRSPSTPPSPGRAVVGFATWDPPRSSPRTSAPPSITSGWPASWIATASGRRRSAD